MQFRIEIVRVTRDDNGVGRISAPIEIVAQFETDYPAHTAYPAEEILAKHGIRTTKRANALLVPDEVKVAWELGNRMLAIVRLID